MEIRKKALKLYICIFIASILAAIISSVFAFFEKGIVRDILVIVAIVIFVCGIAQLLLYRYFSRIYSRSLPKEEREEDIREIPSQEIFTRDQ